jgi:hypothetical protein
METVTGIVSYIDYNTKSRARRPDNQYCFSHAKQRIKLTIRMRDGTEKNLLSHFYLPVLYGDSLTVDVTPSLVEGIDGECVKNTHIILVPGMEDKERLLSQLHFYLKYHVYGNGPDSDKAAIQYKLVLYSKAEKEMYLLGKSSLAYLARTPYDVFCLWSEWFVRGNLGLKSAVPAVLTKENEEKFFRTWYNKHTVRRLRIFGISEADFRCHWYGDCQLYYEILKNPYAVPVLTFDQRETVFRHFPHLRDCDKDAGETIQALFSDVKQGHTATPVDKFKNVDISVLSDYGVRVNNGCCYLDYPLAAEAAIAQHIDGIRFIEGKEVELSLESTLNEEQRGALKTAMEQPLVLVTGGAGRGKSSVLIQMILELSSRQGELSWIVAFPTGKSMMVILDQLPPDIDTFLFGTLSKWIWLQKSAMRERSKPRVVKHLIIDEGSMVSSRLLEEMLRHYPEIEKITIFGDEKQLQPVEWGRPFKQLIGLSSVVRCNLEFNHRCLGKGIVSNADAIARLPVPWQLDEFPRVELKEGEGFEIVIGNKEKVLEQYFELLGTYGVLGVQVISPLNSDVLSQKPTIILDDDGEVSAETNQSKGLNDMIIERIHQLPHARTKYAGHSWMIGDKVMVLKNVYVTGCEVFNGQMGVIVGLIKEGSVVKKGDKSALGNFLCLTKRGWTATVETKDIELALDLSSPSVSDPPSSICGVYVAIPGPKSSPNSWRHREFYVNSLATVHFKSNNVYWSTEIGEYADVPENFNPVADPDDAVVDLEQISVLSMDLLSHAYAITVHKSQGSEWPAVITYIRPCGQENFIGKNIVYTALTRAREKAVLVTTNKAYVDEKCNEIPQPRCEHLLSYFSN